MKFLVYLGHPAQYHFFKNIVKELKLRHEVLYLLKSKEVLEPLLIADGTTFKNIMPEGRRGTKSGIIWGLIKREVKVLREVLKYRPDLLLGSDPAISHVGKLLGIPVLIFSEDDVPVINDLARITYPFASNIVAPDVCDCGRWNHKKLGYAGYMKLAYLHPKYFKNDFRRFKSSILIRMSKLSAYHDKGIGGLSDKIITSIIENLKDKHRIFISSERALNPTLSKYALNINPSELHDVLANATLLISDSQSMSMEAAMLGIPSIRFSDFAGRIGVLEELEKNYHLTFGVAADQPYLLFQKIEQVLRTPNLSLEFQNRRWRMLNEKIDVTAFIVWLIENYPKSSKIIKRNPEYQNRFRHW